MRLGGVVVSGNLRSRSANVIVLKPSRESGVSHDLKNMKIAKKKFKNLGNFSHIL
jgi:hypothetical protein